MSVDIKNYGDADKKLIKKLTAAGKFDASLDQKLNIEKVNVEVMVRWVNERLTELLGFEDDVVVNLVENMLTQTQDAFSGQVKRVDPKQLQIQLTGFLDRQAAPFVAELWKLLLDAQDAPHGIPRAFVERKKAELLKRQATRDGDKAAIRKAGGRDAGGGREDAQRRLVRAAAGEGRRRSRDRRSRSRDRRSRSRDRGGERRRDRSRDRRSRSRDDRRRSRSDSADRRRERRRDRAPGFGAAAPAAPPGRPPLPAPWAWRESRSERGSWYCVDEATGERRWDAPGAEAKVVVRHVLVKHAGSKRPSSHRTATIALSKADAATELEALRATVAAAEDRAGALAAAARDRSDCPSSAKDGQLKPFARGELDKSFEAAAFALEPGALSGVVDTPSGLHLILRLS